MHAAAQLSYRPALRPKRQLAISINVAISAHYTPSADCSCRDLVACSVNTAHSRLQTLQSVQPTTSLLPFYHYYYYYYTVTHEKRAASFFTITPVLLVGYCHFSYHGTSGNGNEYSIIQGSDDIITASQGTFTCGHFVCNNNTTKWNMFSTIICKNLKDFLREDSSTNSRTKIGRISAEVQLYHFTRTHCRKWSATNYHVSHAKPQVTLPQRKSPLRWSHEFYNFSVRVFIRVSNGT